MTLRHRAVQTAMSHAQLAKAHLPAKRAQLASLLELTFASNAKSQSIYQVILVLPAVRIACPAFQARTNVSSAAKTQI